MKKHAGLDPNLLERVKQYALERLAHELSPGLVYHSLQHTRDEVVPAAERLADDEGVWGEARDLLIAAAWLHDMGYVKQPVYHELISARIALEVLPGMGFTEEQTDIIRWIILATALPQSPRNLVEQVMADADLDILGSDHFLARNKNLREELEFLGRRFSDDEWYVNQVKFLEEHHYFTASAMRLRNAGKAENIARLRSLLGR